MCRRREFLAAATAAAALAAASPGVAARTPKRGGILAVRDGALKNYGPNLGYDYGGRLITAWLDR